MSSSRTTLESRSCLRAQAVLALVMILAIPPAHSQQENIPDTPAGQVLAAWLEAFNSGDRSRIGAYQQKYEPASGLPLDTVMSFRASTGGFELVGIRKSEPLYLEFLVKERASDTRAVGRFVLTGSAPPKVETSGLRAIPAGAAVIGFEIDAATRKRVIAGSIVKLNENYVFPETARKMERALRQRQKRGEYDAVMDGEKFASLLTTHLQEVSHDKHLRVSFSAARYPDDLAAPSPEQVAQNRRMTERTNCGFEKVELLAGNVGYVKFNMFVDPALCGPTAIAAMNFLANVDAIIFDLREFTYNLKNLKRATIVGETTGGGAHPVSGQRIDDRFAIGVPFARAINPITQTNWEGTGVEPDVKVAAPDALTTAQKLAGEKLAPRNSAARAGTN
jgi:hypothetical protein